METPRISKPETHDVAAARRITGNLVRMSLQAPETPPESISATRMRRRIAVRALEFGRAWWNGTELFPKRQRHE